MKSIIDAIKSIPIIGEIISFVENAVEAALSAIFKFIGVELPSWKIDLPFIDRLKELAREAAEKAEEFMEYFENVLNLDGKFSSLVEPIIEPLLDAIPTLDLDCDGNETEILTCSLDKLGINVEFDIDDISGMEISGIDLLPEVDVVDILQGFLENAENIGNHLSDLFEDDGVECRQYETVPFDLIDQIETHLNISRDDIPDVAICPINFETCTDLVLPEESTFVENMNNELSLTLERKNRALGVNNTHHSRSLSSYFTCDAKWPFGDTDRFVDWGASITFPLLKEIKLPLISERNQALFRKVFKSKYLNKFSVTMNSKLSGLTTVRFLIGCKEGEFQFYLETLPLIEVDLNWRFLEERKGNDYQFFSQDPNNIFPSDIGPTKNFRPTIYAIQTLAYLQGPNPDLAKFNREMYLVEILNKILCHLDYIHVNNVIGAGSVFIPNSNHDIFMRWLTNYDADWNTWSAPGGGPATNTIGRIVQDLGTDVGDVQNWEFQERFLSRLQVRAYDARKTLKRNRARLGLPPIVVPGDNLGRQKSCRDLYGYDLRPGSLKDYFIEEISESARSITFSGTNFRKARWGARGNTLPFRKQRRTIDFGLRDSHDSPFDLKFIMIEVLINSGPLLAVLGIDSLAVLYQYLVGLAVKSIASVLIYLLNQVAPSPSPSTSESPSGLIPSPTNSPSSSPITLKQQVGKSFLVMAQVLLIAFPAIQMGKVYNLAKKLFNTALPPVVPDQLDSIFDMNAFLALRNFDRPLAEQEVRELQVGSALSTSVNLMRNDPDEEGWKGSKGLKSRYCKDRFCIYLWPKDPYFTEQCYPGQVGFCPYETIVLPNNIV